MLKLSLTVFTAFAALLACTSEKSNPLPPLMPPSGTVDAEHLVTTFGKICLSNFPDIEEVNWAFEEFGFSEIPRPEPSDEGGFRNFVFEDREMSGGVGTVVLHWIGAGGTGGIQKFPECHLKAVLVNPEDVDLALIKLVAPTGEVITLGESQDGVWRSGWYDLSGDSFRVTLHQSLNHINSGDARAPENCGGLQSCRTWGAHTLSVSPAAR